MNKYLHKSNFASTVSGGSVRACGYFRVSTGRQAESDLSIPDQRKQILAFCAGKSWNLLAEYVEPGASATDDARPEFQKMIERATDDDRPFDVILVHSFSRFFRDAFGLEMYIRKLAKAGVRLVSITQELGDDPAQVMMRQVIALFDEYQSRENAKHVLRAMKENARQGFYNGSPVPLGYTTAEVEKRGNRAKKKLVVDPVEAETVRQVFKLYRSGDGRGGPLGIKQVTCWLNERGYRTRKGARFGVATVHGILTNTVYIGEWIFNKREAKTLTEKPTSEHIVVEVPAIIPRDEFDAVQARMKVNAPMTTPPRVVTGPILLTGLATCATCSGAMTLRTGTSKSGQVHRYYSCSVHGRMGKTACKGRAIRMDRLDTIVTDHLVDHLFQPDRLTVMLAGLAAGRAERALEVDSRITTLQTEASQAEDRLKRLYKMVEDGVTDLDDLLKERIAVLKLERDRATAALERIKAQVAPPTTVEPEAIERFGRLMRENVTSGDIPFRKAYIQSVVDRVEVDDDLVRIIGDKTTLEQAIAGNAVRNLGVRSFERKWRARKDLIPIILACPPCSSFDCGISGSGVAFRPACGRGGRLMRPKGWARSQSRMPRFGLVPFTRQSTKGGVFRFRLQLPADVFEALVAAGTAGARRTVTFSLKTRDPLAARSRALRAAADVGDMISAVRSGTIPPWAFDPAVYGQDQIVLPSADRQPVISTPAGSASTPSKMMTLHRVYEEVYLPRRQERKGVPPRRRSRLDMEKAIARFAASAGDPAIGSITKKTAEQFVRSLKLGSVATVKKTTTCLSTICNAAVAASLISSNPFRGLGPDRAAIVAARRSYSRFDMDQLARFFRQTEGEDGAVLWLPRLLLLTGARLEEMAQLRASWFVRRDGVEVIDLHDARVKSAHNRRYIPLHRDLLDLGILDLVRESSDRLFPELRYRASAERWSGSISTRLNREIDEALGADRRLTVHSLRKTFEHAAYVTGVPKPSINAITGHKPGDISEEHYLLLKDDVPLLKQHIDRLEFPFLRKR